MSYIIPRAKVSPTSHTSVLLFQHASCIHPLSSTFQLRSIEHMSVLSRIDTCLWDKGLRKLETRGTELKNKVEPELNPAHSPPQVL